MANRKSGLPNGVYTATLTPLYKDDNINYQLLISHCQSLLKHGSTGIALLGTTGEANSFSITERKRILNRVINGGIPADKLMIGTGCCALPDTVKLTKHALKNGVQNVLVLPPFYYKSVNDSGLFTYFDKLINKVNDDRLHIYLYHFPKMSGLGFSVSLIKDLIQHFPGTIVGIKDSGGDFNNMKQMVKEIPDFQVFAGTEKYLLDILKIGGAGCISATANVTVMLAAQVFKTWQSARPAITLQEHLVKVRTSFEGLPFSGALKAYLAATTNNEQWKGIRSPNELIGTSDLELLNKRLEKSGFTSHYIPYTKKY